MLLDLWLFIYVKHCDQKFHGDIIEKESLLNDLLSVPENCRDLHIPLISRALSQYAEYYGRLSQLADQDIFLVLSAYWLTPIERAIFWLGGMKPDILFHFTPSDLNDDQRKEIEELKQQTVQRETELEAIMREVEVTMMGLAAMEAVHENIKNGEMRAEVARRGVEMIHAVFEEANRLKEACRVKDTRRAQHCSDGAIPCLGGEPPPLNPPT